MKKITFFNHFNNGDLHLSRGFVKAIINRFKELKSDIVFTYAHKRDPEIFRDIPEISWENIANTRIKSEHLGMFVSEETLFINTWYGQQNFKYLNNYGISFDCLYHIFNDVCKNLWNNSISDIEPNITNLFPEINYHYFGVEKTKDWLSANKTKKILIANGPALSGQASNFDMLPFVYRLSEKYPDISFILTSKPDEVKNKDNIFYSKDIINKAGSDLNENAFLSTNCDIIIGRASGVFTFSLTKENLFLRSPNFICFSNLTFSKGEEKFWLNNDFSDKVNYNCKFYMKDVTDNNEAFDIVDRIIAGKE